MNCCQVLSRTASNLISKSYFAALGVTHIYTLVGAVDPAAPQSILTHRPVMFVEFSMASPSSDTTSTAATELEQVSLSWALPARGTINATMI